MTESPSRIKYRAWLGWGLALAGLVLFFLATSPVNRSEAEDAYDYAWCIETRSGIDLLDGHHLLYFPVMKVLHSSVAWTGLRTFPVLVFASAVSTSLFLLLFYRLLRSRLGMKWVDALLASMVLGSSYGVWRYAAEAEIYGISGALSLLLLLVALGREGEVRYPVASALIALVGVCMHVMNFIPAFSIGLLCLLQKRWKTALGYGGVFSFALVLLIFLLLALGWDATGMLNVSPLAYSGGLFTRSSYPRALVGLGTGILSSQFVFGWETVRQIATETFPGMMLSEECFFGETVGKTLAWTGATMAVVCVLAFLAVVARIPWRKGVEPVPVSVKSIVVLSGIWSGLFVAVIFRYDPAAPEFWIQTIPPLFLFCFSFVVLRNGAVRIRVPLTVFVVLLFLHNGWVGMRPLKDENTDYNLNKAAPLPKVMEGDNLILSSDNPVFFHYLRYVCSGEVVNLYAVGDGGEDALINRVETYVGSVYAFNDLGNPSPNMRLRVPIQWERAKILGERLRNVSSVVLLQ